MLHWLNRCFADHARQRQGGFILPTASSALSRFVALCRASQMRVKALAAYLLYFPRRHQRASTRARKRGAAPYATKFNSAELSRFTPAIQPIMYRCQELSLQRIELAITSVSSLLGNQLVASGSQRACDHGKRAVATPRVKLSFSFLSPFSIH